MTVVSSEFHLALEAFGSFREGAEQGSFDQEDVGGEKRKPECGAYSLCP